METFQACNYLVISGGMGDGCNPSLRENDGWVAAWLVQAYPQTENPWKVHIFWKMLEQILQAVPFCPKEIELHLPSYVTFKVERYPSYPSGNIDDTVDGRNLAPLGMYKTLFE